MRVICSLGKGISAIDADRVDMISCNGGTYCTVYRGETKLNFEAVTPVDVTIPLHQEIIDITSSFKHVPYTDPCKCTHTARMTEHFNDTVTPILLCSIPGMPFDL